MQDSVINITEKISEDVKDEAEDVSSADGSYQIKPSLQAKFKEIPVKEIIRNVVGAILTGKSYDAELAKKWTINIANEVSDKVKDLEMKRYKHVVQVIIGEMRGAGVKCGARCVWDSDVDNYTSEIFINDTIFCVTAVFAIYLY
ncbi:unnamed protein product [Psylliodes chrysocephalus]|uniref:Dynein light chain n=1 Tax=Psylliodes chrysocephalus TaxID=3402493 RepID=A0A9P0GLE1_9CUCU|nr:unnamed protein product [Psylliodes chrysocephala]